MILLQEVRSGPFRYLSKALPDYAFASAGRTDGAEKGERLAIGVRKSLSDAPGIRVRWFSENPCIPGRFRGARTNRISIGAELNGLHVVCVHLEEQPNPHLGRCVELILEWFGSDAIVAGDFNCRIDDPALEPFWKAGYKDALAPMAPAGPGSATHHGFSGRGDGTRIDHILVPRGVGVSQSWIDQTQGGALPSDHWAVVAMLDDRSVTVSSDTSGTN